VLYYYIITTYIHIAGEWLHIDALAEVLPKLQLPTLTHAQWQFLDEKASAVLRQRATERRRAARRSVAVAEMAQAQAEVPQQPAEVPQQPADVPQQPLAQPPQPAVLRRPQRFHGILLRRVKRLRTELRTAHQVSRRWKKRALAEKANLATLKRALADGSYSKPPKKTSRGLYNKTTVAGGCDNNINIFNIIDLIFNIIID
jgi:hypothetical protein